MVSWEQYIKWQEDAEEMQYVDDLARALWAHYWGEETGPDATWERMERYAFKYTTCGISFWHSPDVPGMVVISGYCEGTDRECQPIEMRWPYTLADIEDAVKRADQDGIDLWNETHGCEDCGEEDEFGNRAVNPGCKACKGVGVVI